VAMRSAAASLLGSYVRIALMAYMIVSCVCRACSNSAKGLSLFQNSLVGYVCLIEFYLKTSK
jgi:hypothetical protein